MERAFLVSSTLCFLAGFAYSMYALGAKVRQPSRWNFVVMLLGFALQLGFLRLRSGAVGRCPLTNLFEVLVFLSWSVVLLYFVVGSTYRLSLLGTFTAPLVFLIQVVAQLLPAASVAPVFKKSAGFWPELHAAISLVSYGAFALACVAGVMFLVQERHLKRHNLNSFFQNLPPIANLSVAMQRLMLAGFVLLTVGIVSGFFAGHTPVATIALAVCVWLPYGAVLVMRRTHRLGSRRIAWLAVAAFALALTTLGVLSAFHIGN
ncbi:MAG: cytochrome c biogenesis protein CcsA [Chthoniobacteraceae bacterium]